MCDLIVALHLMSCANPHVPRFLRGMLPLSHGVADNGIDLNPDTANQGFAAHLGRAGYKTAIIGKAHLSSKATFEPTGTPECQYSSINFGDDWQGRIWDLIMRN